MWGDIWHYLRALARYWVFLAAGPIVNVVLLGWSVFEKTNISERTFWTASLIGVPIAGFLAWREEHRKVASSSSAADKRVADRARELARMLDATFEDGPPGLEKLEDLTGWAARVLRGFEATERVLKEALDLRAEASLELDQAIGTARSEYYAAADVINKLFKGGGLSIQYDERPAIEAKLRTAVAHMRSCISALRAAEGRVFPRQTPAVAQSSTELQPDRRANAPRA